MHNTLSVFTKQWKMPLHELGEFVSGLGFDAIELPVRPGYQVDPSEVSERLPEAVKILGSFGVRIASVASSLDESIIHTCSDSGIAILRHMVSIGDDGYIASESRTREELKGMVPLLDRLGVTVGIQNHCGRMVCNASGLRTLLAGFEPRHVAAVWDAAHNALCGEEPELALDIVWPHLCMVNLKNGYWKPHGEPGRDGQAWQVYWTLGNRGLASWSRVIAYLVKHKYNGPICLTAEYSELADVNKNIAIDIVYAKELLQREVSQQ